MPNNRNQMMTLLSEIESLCARYQGIHPRLDHCMAAFLRKTQKVIALEISPKTSFWDWVFGSQADMPRKSLSKTSIQNR